MATARLNGTLNNDGGEACDCGFEYGLDTGYGTTTPIQSKETGEIFSQVITGLLPDTAYHFRAIATNSAGITYGEDRTLLTGPSGAGNYWYHLNVKGINLPYEDLDGTKEIHVVLKNLSPTGKLGGDSGEVKVNIDYEPAA